MEGRLNNRFFFPKIKFFDELLFQQTTADSFQGIKTFMALLWYEQKTFFWRFIYLLFGWHLHFWKKKCYWNLKLTGLWIIETFKLRSSAPEPENELTGSSIRGFFCLSLFKRVWYWSRFALSKNISSSNSIASFVSIGGVSSRVVAKDPVAPLCKLRPDWLDFGRGGIFAPKNV